MRKLALSVEDGTAEYLREVAARYGMIARSGRYGGQGNISQMMDAIARGRLAIVPEASVGARALEAATSAAKAAAQLMTTIGEWPAIPEADGMVRIRVYSDAYAAAIREFREAMAAAARALESAEGIDYQPGLDLEAKGNDAEG